MQLKQGQAIMKHEGTYKKTHLLGSIGAHTGLAAVTGGASLAYTLPTAFLGYAAGNIMLSGTSMKTDASKYEKLSGGQTALTGLVNGALKTSLRPLTYGLLSGSLALDFTCATLKGSLKMLRKSVASVKNTLGLIDDKEMKEHNTYVGDVYVAENFPITNTMADVFFKAGIFAPDGQTKTLIDRGSKLHQIVNMMSPKPSA